MCELYIYVMDMLMFIGNYKSSSSGVKAMGGLPEPAPSVRKNRLPMSQRISYGRYQISSSQSSSSRLRLQTAILFALPIASLFVPFSALNVTLFLFPDIDFSTCIRLMGNMIFCCYCYISCDWWRSSR